MNNVNCIQILKWMSKPNTDIQACSERLMLVRKSNPSFSTEEKVALISQFLSANQDEICQDSSCLKLISALKEKLISEACEDLDLIHKICCLSYEKVGGISPCISVIKAEVPIKMGLIFESKNQMDNPVLFMEVEKSLMRQTPVVVNRNFMIAHRHKFFTSQIPLQFYHQKGGNFTVIFPEGKNPIDWGFNDSELTLSTFKELLPLENAKEEDCLDRLLLYKARVNLLTGHGNQGIIAGLPIDQFLKIQNVLSSKGVQFGILDTCHAGGSNIDALQKTPFPLLVMSSSEVSSLGGHGISSYDMILECAKKGNITSLLRQEKVQTLIRSLPKENTPTLILPQGKPSFEFKNNRGMIRLDERLVADPLHIHEEGGFISTGGTRHHLINSVISEKVSLETIVENTFKLLNLENTTTEKAIFIRKMDCHIENSSWWRSHIDNVLLFASHHDQGVIYSYNGSNYLWIKDSKKEWIQLRNKAALYQFYLYFTKTLTSKGSEGAKQLLAFQKQFFGDSLSLLHQMYGMLVKAYCFPEQVGYLDLFLKQVQSFKKSEGDISYPLSHLKCFASHLDLKSYAEIFGDIDIQEGKTAALFFQLCKEEKVEEAKGMLKSISKNDLNYLCMAALQNNDILATSLLLEVGLDPNQGLFCVEHIEMLIFLLEKGAKVDYVSKNQTPLLSAIVKRNVPIIVHLLEKGAPLFAAEEFKRAYLDTDLLKVILENSSPDQLSYKSLVFAYVAKDKDLAEALVNKGVKYNGYPCIMTEYLETMKGKADTQVLEWILAFEEKWLLEISHPIAQRSQRSTLHHTVFGNALEYSSFEVIQSLEKILKSDISSFWGFERLKRFHVYKNTFENLSSASQQDFAELYLGTEEDAKNIFKFCVDHENFEGITPSNIQYRLKQGASDPEARRYYLKAIIEQSPKVTFKPFYLALLEGNLLLAQKSLVALTDQDWVQIWKYCPPSALLMQLKPPPDELLRLVFDQLKKGELEKMHVRNRKAILTDMYALCKNHLDMKASLPLYCSLSETWELLK